MCLHLLVDVVALGEGVGVLDVCLSIVLICLTYAGVCTHAAYLLAICVHAFFVAPPTTPTHIHVLT